MRPELISPTFSMVLLICTALLRHLCPQGCYCERLLTTGSNNQNQANGAKTTKDGEEKSVSEEVISISRKGLKILFQLCFGIMYRRENQRQYELRADTVSECKAWIDAIKMARYSNVMTLHVQHVYRCEQSFT